MRNDERSADQLRPITIERNYTCHAEGSVLISFGNTKVLCNACLLYTSPSPRDGATSRMPSSA